MIQTCQEVLDVIAAWNALPCSHDNVAVDHVSRRRITEVPNVHAPPVYVKDVVCRECGASSVLYEIDKAISAYAEAVGAKPPRKGASYTTTGTSVAVRTETMKEDEPMN